MLPDEMGHPTRQLRPPALLGGRNESAAHHWCAALLFMDTPDLNAFVEDVGDDDFEQRVLRPSHDRPVLVDIYSDFCIPCQEILPIVCELAEKYRDRLTIVKINISKAARFRETYLGPLAMTPSFLFFKQGKPVRTSRIGRLLGQPAFIASTRAGLEKRIRAMLA